MSRPRTRTALTNQQEKKKKKIEKNSQKSKSLLKEDVLSILKRATDLLKAEPNMLHVDAPVTVCGDTHGQ